MPRHKDSSSAGDSYALFQKKAFTFSAITIPLFNNPTLAAGLKILHCQLFWINFLASLTFASIQRMVAFIEISSEK